VIQVNRNLPKRNTLSEIGKNWIEKYFYHKKGKAVSWLRGFVPGFSPWRPVFDPGSDPASFVVKKMWHWDMFLTKYFGVPLSVSFRQRSVLVFIHPLLLDGQRGEAWEHSEKAILS
jgi:hypothetical protein